MKERERGGGEGEGRGGGNRTTEERTKKKRREHPLFPSLSTPCRFKTSPCVGSKRFRVYWQNARMWYHMRAFCQYTRRRFEPTHGGVLNVHTWVFQLVTAHTTPHRTTPHHTTHTPHTPHTTHTTHHTHHTQHNTKTQNAHPTHTYTLSTHPTHTLNTRTTISTHTHNHFNTHAQHTTYTHTHTPTHMNAWICAQSTTDRDLETKK